MIAETLAGIALVKSAVDGIKSAIGTAKEAKEAERKAKIEAQRAHDEMMEGLKNSMLVGLVVAIGMALFFAFIIFLPK